MTNLQDIFGAYRKAMAGIGSVEVIQGNLTDAEAQAAIRGRDTDKESLYKFAIQDVTDFLINHDCCHESRGFVGGVCDNCGGTVKSDKIKLQIKAECDVSYLIYLNFIIE